MIFDMFLSFTGNGSTSYAIFTFDSVVRSRKKLHRPSFYV